VSGRRTLGTRLRRAAADDQGTVLVLALAFLACFGLLAGTLLSLGTTSLRITASVRDDVAQTYAEDGALDGAINTLGPTTTSGVHGTDNASCFSLPAASVAGSSHAFSSNVAVRCLGRSGSAVTTAAPVSGAQPAQAVLTGASNTSEGVNLTAGSVDVLGNVVAKSRVSVPADSSLGVSGTLTSPTCTLAGTLHADTNQCNTTTTATDPGASDLSWAPPGLGTSASPSSQYPAPVDVLPSCASTVTFSPASFYSAAALSALFAGCPSATFVFQPGVYLFDFQDAGASAARAWTIASAATTVVGGALATATTCNPASSGVEFVFAGESQLKVTAGTVNLCGAFADTTPYDATTSPAAPATAGQHIAVYGLKTSGTLDDSNTRTPKSTTISGWTLPSGKTGPQTFAAVDGVKASTTLTTNGATSSISGALGTMVPPDATITDASLTATYTETGNGSLAFNALFQNGTYYFPIGVIGCNGSCGGTTPTWSCGTAPGNSGSCASYNVNAAAVDPVTVQVTATNNSSSAFTATIDSLVVSFTYTEPLSASSGCLVTAPYPTAGCALLSVSGSAPSTVLNIDGTIYAWLAPIDLSAKLQPAVVVDRGIVARDLQLGLTPAAPCQGPLVALAAAGATPRQVMAEASIAGTVTARAEVCFSDVGGAVNGSVPSVLAWTHL
jgi:hypothetical protein